VKATHPSHVGIQVLYEHFKDTYKLHLILNVKVEDDMGFKFQLNRIII